MPLGLQAAQRSCPSFPRRPGPQRDTARRSGDREPPRQPHTLYELLSLEPGASIDSIKAAYRVKQKVLHPDVCGPAATEMAVLLNLAIATLSVAATRQQYDRSLWHSVSTASHSAAAGAEALFVNEAQCIGCMQCVSVCPNTFVLEQEHGRARVGDQQGEPPDLQEEAADLCPVECIHRVPAQQLARLEHALTLCEREDAATLADRRSGSLGAGPARNDPFSVAASLPASWETPQAGTPGGSCSTSSQDHLAAAIAQAWLGLPPEVQQQAWP